MDEDDIQANRACRLIVLALTLCMLTGAVSTALGESETVEDPADAAAERL